MGRFFIALLISSSILASTVTDKAGAAENKADCETELAPDTVKEGRPHDEKAKIEAAAHAFKRFFSAIDHEMAERTDVIRLIEVALLAREHVLLMGPPGNAKSHIADAILGHITDGGSEKADDGGGKASYYRIQMTPETTMSETHGPISPKEIFESGRIVRHYDQGMLQSRNVFIDEIFDARANAQRNILGLLAERQHAQGTEIVRGKIETVIAATNRYLDEVYEKAGDQGPKALLDRFSFNIYVPGEFQFAKSYHKIFDLEAKNKSERPALTFNDLDTLRELTRKVKVPASVAQYLALLSYRMKAQTEAMEQSALKIYRKKVQNGENPAPPYRATKYHSPRTLFKAVRMLRAFVVRDWIQKGGRRGLVATADDLTALKSFFALSGPSEEFTHDLLERTVNPYERSQLSAILEESKIFEDTFMEIAREMNEVIYKYALVELDGEINAAEESGDKEKILSKLSEMWLEVGLKTSSAEQSAQSGRDIGYSVVAEFIEGKIRKLAGNEFQATIQAKSDELLRRREALEAEELARRQAEAAAQRRREMEEQAKKIAAERQERIDAYMKSRLMNAFKDPSGAFDLIAEVKIGSEPNHAIGDAQRIPFHIDMGEESLIFTPGAKGFRLAADGTKSEIVYERDVPDAMLREMLSSRNEKSFIRISEKKFALRVASIVAVVDADTLRPDRFHFLNLNGRFTFSVSGQFGIEYSTQTNNIRRIDLRDGSSQNFSVSSLNNYSGHIQITDNVQASNDTLWFSYSGGRAILKVAFTTNSSNAFNTNNSNVSFHLVTNSADHRKLLGLYYSGNQIYLLPMEMGTSFPVNLTPLVMPTNLGNLVDASLSPTGDYIAIARSGSPCWVTNVKTGETTEVNFDPSAIRQLLSLTWVDGQTLAVRAQATDGSNLYRVYRLKPLTREKLEAIASGQEGQAQP